MRVVQQNDFEIGSQLKNVLDNGVVVATGGAKGITAKCVQTLATATNIFII